MPLRLARARRARPRGVERPEVLAAPRAPAPPAPAAPWARPSSCSSPSTGCTTTTSRGTPGAARTAAGLLPPTSTPQGVRRSAEFVHDVAGRYVVADNDDARALTGELGGRPRRPGTAPADLAGRGATGPPPRRRRDRAGPRPRADLSRPSRSTPRSWPPTGPAAVEAPPARSRRRAPEEPEPAPSRTRPPDARPTREETTGSPSPQPTPRSSPRSAARRRRGASPRSPSSTWAWSRRRRPPEVAQAQGPGLGAVVGRDHVRRRPES